MPANAADFSDAADAADFSMPRHFNAAAPGPNSTYAVRKKYKILK
jgi:hypothetical protein